MYLTRYGGMWGTVPATQGLIHWVAPTGQYTIAGQTYSSSDTNDGKDPRRALATVTQAITNATASVGDVIVLLEGTHTVTATVVVNKAGLTILGVRGQDGYKSLRPRTILTSTGTSDELLDIRVSNTELGFLTLRGTTAYSAVSFQTTAGIDNLYIHDCFFDMFTPAKSLGTRGLDFGNRQGGTGSVGGNERIGGMGLDAAATAYVERCQFWADGAQGEAVHVATAHLHMKDCRINLMNASATWASPFVIATNGVNTILDTVVWTSAGTMTAALSGFPGSSGANSVILANCRFGGITNTQTLEGFGANVIKIATLYEQVWANTTANFSIG